MSTFCIEDLEVEREEFLTDEEYKNFRFQTMTREDLVNEEGTIYEPDFTMLDKLSVGETWESTTEHYIYKRIA